MPQAKGFEFVRSFMLKEMERGKGNYFKIFCFKNRRPTKDSSCSVELSVNVRIARVSV